jgi:hypothetical protein
MEYDLQDLVNHGLARAKISKRNFQIFLHEDLPEYWTLQFNLLVALKSVFDCIRPTEATVVFPNLSFRYPSRDIEVLLKLTGIRYVCDGFRIWIEHLVDQGNVQTKSSNWQHAFRLTPQGYRIVLTKGRGNYNNLPNTPLRQSVVEHRRRARLEMTQAIERAFNECILSQVASDEALKDIISQKASDLLPRYMEPLPLDFAIHNYKSLMETSYKAGMRMDSNAVALHVISDARESLASGFGSKVKIVIVRGTAIQFHANTPHKASEERLDFFHRNLERNKLQNLSSCGICFASLPGTRRSAVGHGLSSERSSDRGFCECIELPTHISGSFVRSLLMQCIFS